MITRLSWPISDVTFSMGFFCYGLIVLIVETGRLNNSASNVTRSTPSRWASAAYIASAALKPKSIERPVAFCISSANKGTKRMTPRVFSLRNWAICLRARIGSLVTLEMAAATSNSNNIGTTKTFFALRWRATHNLEAAWFLSVTIVRLIHTLASSTTICCPARFELPSV